MKNVLRMLLSSIALISLLSTAVSQAEDELDKEVNYKELFLSHSRSHQEKWRAALNAEIKTNHVRLEICDLLSVPGSESTARFYALTALVAANDIASVDEIIKFFAKAETRSRYYALALGKLGDKSVVPVLKKVYHESRRSYVKRDILNALRLIDDRLPGATPAATEDDAIKLTLSSSSKEVSYDQEFELVLQIKNTGDEKYTYDPIVFENHFRIVSAAGYRVLPPAGVFSLRPLPSGDGKNVTDSGQKVIMPGEKVELHFDLRFTIGEYHIDPWLDQFLEQRAIYVNAQPHFKLNISPYQEDKDYEYKMYMVLGSGKGDNPSLKIDIDGYDDFSGKKDPIVSNTVVVKLVGSPPAQGAANKNE